MAEVKWIKIVTNIFDDEKMLMIDSLPSSDSIMVIWFKLLCLAGKTNNSGVFIFNDKIPYTDEMLASIFRRDVNTVRLALKTFEEFGMVEIVDNVITIPNWSKHQTLDAYERQKERDRLKKQKKRAEQKALISAQSGDKSGDKSGDVPVLEEDIEEDVEEEGYIESTADKPPNTPSGPPQKPKSPKQSRPPEPAAHKRGEYGWVRLTDEQFQRLVSEYGLHETARAIAYVDESAQGTGNKNHWKDWNLVVRKCIREGWGKNRQNYGSPPPQRQGNGFQTSNPFMEMLEEERGRR